VLVLSGETTLDVALGSDPQPDLTALNIEEFVRLLLASKA
jgi:NagD protein